MILPCHNQRDILVCSDVDLHWSYANPDPQNLMNAEPDPGQQKHQIDINPSLKSQEEKNISYFLRFRLEKINF